MKAKWEGAFAVVLAVTLIFSIQYYYFSTCSWYEPQEHIASDRNATAVAVPVSSITSEQARLRDEAQRNLTPQQASSNHKVCGCWR